MADAAGGEPDEHLAGLRLGEVDLLDDERAAELLEHGGADLHGASLARGDRLQPVAGLPEQPLVQRERLRRGDVPAEALDGPRAAGAAPSPRRAPDRRGAR